MGESLVGSGTTSTDCTPGTVLPTHGTFSVSGTAAGPYPGTFTASGTFDVGANFRGAVSEEFTITSGGTEITGTKTGSNLGVAGSIFCNPAGTGGAAIQFVTTLPAYEATIRPDTGGAWRDIGTAGLVINTTGAPFAGAPASGLLQNFTASNGLVQLQPATKDDCKNGGYEQFGYRNQGQCIKDVNARRHE